MASLLRKALNNAVIALQYQYLMSLNYGKNYVIITETEVLNILGTGDSQTGIQGDLADFKESKQSKNALGYKLIWIIQVAGTRWNLSTNIAKESGNGVSITDIHTYIKLGDWLGQHSFQNLGKSDGNHVISC